MSAQLLEIGVNTDQLSLCRLSLILGVYSDDNRIEKFLKFACSILHVKKGILAFHGEPYIWHFSHDGFNALKALPDLNFDDYFLGDDVLQKGHSGFAQFSDDLHQSGIEHQRLLAIKIKDSEQTLGHIVLFDNAVDEINEEWIDAVTEFVSSLVGSISMHKENVELKELYDEQVALITSKNKYLQIIAHDLRAPFHGLLGFTDVLLHERHLLDQDQVDDIVQYLDDTAQSTFKLLESLLNWSMVEGGRFVYHPINFNLSEATSIVMDVLSGFAQKKNIKLLNQSLASVQVYADINMVTSIIQNLVSNALKFSRADGTGTVMISTEVEDKQVHIYVKDSGLGMSNEKISSIFNPERAVSVLGTQGEMGTGLGLMLCKRFVDLNFGTITVTSKELEGTTFKVTLPSAVAKPVLPVVETLKI